MEREQAKTVDEFKHPPLFIELLKLYKEYYRVYPNQPKLFRVSIGERIMEELAEALKLVVMANFNKKNESIWQESEKYLLILRGKNELLKAYFLIAWEMKCISHGFYGVVSERLEEIGRQTYNWSQWLKKQNHAGTKEPVGA